MATSLSLPSVMSLPTVVDVSEATTIKNTFLDWATPTEAPKRRCNSVPRSWMPGEFCTDISCSKSVEGEDETTASYSSDKEMITASMDLDSFDGSDNDFLPDASTPRSSSSSYFECLECDAESTVDSIDTDAMPSETPKPVVEVKLIDFVGNAPPAKPAAQVTRTKLKATAQPFSSVCDPPKLRATARPFTSMRVPPSGIQMVIQAAKDVLASDPSVVDVQMLEGAMGGTCTIVAHTAANAPHKNPRYYLNAAKTALLSSAEHSQDTYIMGYETKPFTKIDKFSFTATIANIPACQQNTACWDSYKNGFCHRRMTCRWTHPCESQVKRLVIRVQHKGFEACEADQEE